MCALYYHQHKKQRTGTTIGAGHSFLADFWLFLAIGFSPGECAVWFPLALATIIGLWRYNWLSQLALEQAISKEKSLKMKLRWSWKCSSGDTSTDLILLLTCLCVFLLPCVMLFPWRHPMFYATTIDGNVFTWYLLCSLPLAHLTCHCNLNASTMPGNYVLTLRVLLLRLKYKDVMRVVGWVELINS